MDNILIIAAHPDDEILGVGGVVKRLSGEGKCVRAVILGEGLTSRKDARADTSQNELDMLQEDARRSAKIIGYQSIGFCNFPDNRFDQVDRLDIIKCVSTFVEKYHPDTVFTHHHGDLNIDHRRTCEAVLTACRPVGCYGVKRIYAFETPSSTEWNYTYVEPFMPNLFYDVSHTFEYKQRAMECYRTENTVWPHPRSAHALSALAEYRGSSIGVDKAEAFMVLRDIR